MRTIRLDDIHLIQPYNFRCVVQSKNIKKVIHKLISCGYSELSFDTSHYIRSNKPLYLFAYSDGTLYAGIWCRIYFYNHSRIIRIVLNTKGYSNDIA